jgi:N-methylhydantoinase A
MGIRVGIDTGGTFTDLVAVDDRTGRWYLAKVPSNPKQPVAAISAALEQAAFDSGDVDFIVVGTTIGINAVLTRTGARVVYLTTQGFEDIPQIQRINRKHHYDFHWRKPAPLASGRDCIGIEERIDAYGDVLTALDEEQVQAAVKDLAATGAEQSDQVAVAICFLFSYLSPQHERAAREAIHAVAPDLPVSLSHEVAPIWREYERGTAAILDAYMKPALKKYVAGVTDAFARQGAGDRWSLLKSNGGHALAEEALRKPAHILLSGIAGGAIGGAYFARQAGAQQAIVVDMGGTSCDVCLVVDGEPLFSSEYEIEFGLPVSVPTIHTHTIGAGGGSIGWVDPGGFLQVGPQSAGADPGPACYDAGGSEPTITDANLLLGRLDASFFLGGRLQLKPELSGAAMRTLADRLGHDEVEVASSMIRIANESMANAIRIVTVEQGIDPRDFAIVAMGGAGPTHACGIAESIGIDRVIVPPHPGVTSAFGALAAPVRVDEVRSVALKSSDLDVAGLAAMVAELEATAQANFAAQSPGGEQPRVERAIAMRYQGQNYEQEVALPDGALDAAALERTFERYHELHHEFYGYRFDGAPIELVRIAVAVAGPDAELPPLHAQAAEGERAGRSADVYFDEGGFQPTDVIPRTEVGEEPRNGPAIVESIDTTVVVPPGWALRALPGGVMELRRGEAARAPLAGTATASAGA